ncbi:MAG: kynureninase [Gemmataceae bacterium]|nr:kynureninase [Gemmataceae bacterium]
MLRDSFHLPPGVYLCGHSLGAQPRAARALVVAELDAWATQGVEAHFKPDAPWYAYHETVREPLARLAGAMPSEVVAMNGLTVNLHLLLASFFRPQGRRCKILIDEPTFPSDRYAVASHLAQRGLDPATHLVSLPIERIPEALDETVAVALLAGVNYLTGEVLDIPAMAALCRSRGVVLGLDLAHAMGNVELALHADGVDFAVWCSYKYLNAGPGAVAGAFVHERHGDAGLPRLAGWWGNDPATRFRMRTERDFVPRPGADGWQLSNPPILALAPLRASLALFDQATVPALRRRSLELTEGLIRALPPAVELVSPREPGRRGNMLCLRVAEAKRVHEALAREGIACDLREPDILRASLCPLYNDEGDARKLAEGLRRWATRSRW